MEKYYLQILKKAAGKDKFGLVLKTYVLKINEAATENLTLTHAEAQVTLLMYCTNLVKSSLLLFQK